MENYKYTSDAVDSLFAKYRNRRVLNPPEAGFTKAIAPVGVDPYGKEEEEVLGKPGLAMPSGIRQMPVGTRLASPGNTTDNSYYNSGPYEKEGNIFERLLRGYFGGNSGLAMPSGIRQMPGYQPYNTPKLSSPSYYQDLWGGAGNGPWSNFNNLNRKYNLLASLYPDLFTPRLNSDNGDEEYQGYQWF